MDRNALASAILKFDGILLLIVAIIHFAATPFALSFVASQSSPESYAQIKPPFLLSFVVVGVLLIPIGLSTFYCAEFIRSGQRWARTICYFNAAGILLLPLSLVSFMPARYFRAILFLIAAALVWLVAISMVAPLILARTERPTPG